MIEDDAQTDPLCRIDLHQDALNQPVDERQDQIGIARPRLGLADALAEERNHAPQPVGIGAGGDLQSLAQVVAQHHVPASKELAPKKIGDAAVNPLAGLLARDQVMHIAVEHEDARRAGEVLFGKFAHPVGEPRQHAARTVNPARRFDYGLTGWSRARDQGLRSLKSAFAPRKHSPFAERKATKNSADRLANTA